MNTWRAGCSESCTSGSEGGPEKPTNRKTDRALRSDPYTYIATGQSWMYLATVIDLGSRKVLGYSMANHMRTNLVSDALKMAIAGRGGVVAGIIFHSDRGSQYTSGEFGLLLNSYDMVQSVLVDRHQYRTQRQARSSIFAWIVLYNTRRLHSTLGYISPDQWENKYNQHTTHKAA
jgi:transposase InsO family protein